MFEPTNYHQKKQANHFVASPTTDPPLHLSCRFWSSLSLSFPLWGGIQLLLDQLVSLEGATGMVDATQLQHVWYQVILPAHALIGISSATHLTSFHYLQHVPSFFWGLP